MSLGLLGQKLGMTRIFADDGASIPVTVVSISENRVSQVKTNETDGYNSIQVTAGSKKANRVTAPQKGHFAKAGIEAGNISKEFRLTAEEVAKFESGSIITVEMFEAGQLVDVTATSKGKGFAGAIKRHNFSAQRATHGNSLSHRAPGSIGQNQDPGRVFPGKKMAGQYGNKQITTQNLELVKVDVERGLLLIKGAISGSKGGQVMIRPSVKVGA